MRNARGIGLKRLTTVQHNLLSQMGRGGIVVVAGDSMAYLKNSGDTVNRQTIRTLLSRGLAQTNGKREIKMQTQRLFSVELVIDSPMADDIGELDFGISSEAVERYLANNGHAKMGKLRAECELVLNRIAIMYLSDDTGNG